MKLSIPKTKGKQEKGSHSERHRGAMVGTQHRQANGSPAHFLVFLNPHIDCISPPLLSLDEQKTWVPDKGTALWRGEQESMLD